ncbi:penicillin-binding protein 1A [Thiolinea disciformis]|uniref:penicillin-binding protein 1A n=1 Tax=Thiolinea disciformis TaxID=125614 RepID=UPI000378227B|nr:penicillin-binding protein 1A [Thiolinea disciformis]
MRLLLKLISALFSSLFTLMMFALLGLTGIYLYLTPQLPDPQLLRQMEIQIPLRIYSRDNKLIAEFGSQRSRPVTLNEIPEKLRQAFIAIEDSRYYDHAGIDIVGVFRALKSVVSTGSASQGASTITMQLARNAFLDNDKTIQRKLREVLLALRIEQKLTKQEILELYLNKIYLGNRAYGIAAAAETYYGKDHLEDLTLAQMAMLAGLPKAPSRYNPIANESRSMIRRDYILKRMQELGFITQQDYSKAVREPNTATVHAPDIQVYAPYMAEMVRRTLFEQYDEKVYTQGLHVYTTLDSNLQSYAVNALRQTLDEYDQRHGYRGPEERLNLADFKERDDLLDKLSTYQPVGDLQAAVVLKTGNERADVLLLNEQATSFHLADVAWARAFIESDKRGPAPKRVSDVLKVGDVIRVRPAKPLETPETKTSTTKAPITNSEWQFSQIPKVGGALILMDPKNGALRAVMGGYDFEYTKFNRATQAIRQPGSSFKPFLYSAAISKGYTPDSIVNDAPITIITEDGKTWEPKNFGGKYIGPTTLREALTKSRNLVSVRLIKEIGVPYTTTYARRFGFPEKDLPQNLTLALGTAMTNPLQMATAYATFANGGFKIEPNFITKIQDNTGKIIYDAMPFTKRVCGDNVDTCPLRIAQEQESGVQGAAGVTKQPDNIINAKKPSETEPPTQTNEPQVPAAQRIMDSHTHFQIVDVMKDVIRIGTASHAGRALKRDDIAGKTGTTNDERDTWFCGFSPDYVAVAWSGFDDMSRLGNGETSGRLAVPMWTRLMQNVLKDVPERPWVEPPVLQTVKVDAITGSLANDQTTTIVEEGKALPPKNDVIAPKKTTPRFEFTDTRGNDPAENANRATPAAPRVIRKEVVEIPEQIF